MKKILFAFFIVSVFYSCQDKTEIEKDFSCNSSSFSDLEITSDFKNLFSMELPKNWKTKLYFDDGQSSIFGADTTRQLTKSFLLDVSFVQKSINFDEIFKLNLEREKLSEQLIRIKNKNTKFNDKESYYSLSVGKKGNYPYQILDYFIKINDQNFLHVKTQIYGDAKVNDRLCTAINLIEKIKIQ